MKITKDFYRNLEEKLPKTNTIKVNIGEDVFTVELKNYLTHEEKTAMFESLLKFTETEEEVSDTDMQVLVTLVVYEALTDIEFPEDIIEKVAQFTALIEAGVLTEVNRNLKPNLINELVDFVQTAFEIVTEEFAKMAKEEIEKTPIKKTPPIKMGRPIK